MNKNIVICAMITLTSLLAAHDVLVELKGSAFVPTSTTFKEIYHTCGDFGGEVTAGQLWSNLYTFGSVDFFVKNGNTAELNSPTKVTMVNFAAGLKYFVPFHHGDFYVGLGVQPSHLSTKDLIPASVESTQWGCGGVAKVGFIIDMPYSLFTDIFYNYSFVSFKSSNGGSKVPVNGSYFGVGIGYRFN